MRVKRIVILGSTGTIGVNTLDVISRFPGRFRVVGLTAFNNVPLLLRQIRTFQPRFVAVGKGKVADLEKKISLRGVTIVAAETGLSRIVALKDVDLVVIGISGGAALEPFLCAVRAGKTVAPANKEALVMAGDILMREARKYGAKVIPVDSEQSAIFQCLEGRQRQEVKHIYLTASGGALARIPRSRFDRLPMTQILHHPRWKMGRKITIDSATMMNKGFEVIEAQKLFALPVADIKVIVHPQAIIHSMVTFKDGSLMAQMGITDMRLPIQYALSYPERWDSGLPEVDFFRLKKLEFAEPNHKKFPCLRLAIDAARRGGTFPCVLAAADEEAVAAFLKGRIRFSQIFTVVSKVIDRHRPVGLDPELNDILAADQWSRNETRAVIGRLTW